MTDAKARKHSETHKLDNIGWLRAAVLGANDGIVSTSSLILGVAAASASHESILLSGIAGLASGAMSMAAGEYISVSSQADSERSAIEQETRELKADYASEFNELVGIYVKRGLDMGLAQQVAEQLMAKDPLGTHARDELGISELSRARPLQAAGASAISFAAGATLPLVVAMFTPGAKLMPVVALACLFSLAGLGAISAKLGGASPLRGALRVTFWSALAMLLTSLVGSLFAKLA